MNSGLCIDVNFTQRLDGGFVTYLHMCHAGENQRWTLNAVGQIVSDWYSPEGKAMCLDIHYGRPYPNGHNGYTLYAHPCHDGINQKWQMKPDLGSVL